MYNLRDVTEIQFNRYPEKAGEGLCTTVKIPLVNTSREEALKVMDVIRRNPRIGMTRAFLTNGNTI